MPKLFNEKYARTRVIIDATEVFIQQSSHPELLLLQLQNHNTYIGFIGIITIYSSSTQEAAQMKSVHAIAGY